MPQVLSAEDRRALEILTGHHNGCTEDELRLLGFTEGVIDELLRVGLAIAETTRIGTKMEAGQGAAHQDHGCGAEGAMTEPGERGCGGWEGWGA
jgi:hypothetical protein